MPKFLDSCTFLSAIVGDPQPESSRTKALLATFAFSLFSLSTHLVQTSTASSSVSSSSSCSSTLPFSSENFHGFISHAGSDKELGEYVKKEFASTLRHRLVSHGFDFFLDDKSMEGEALDPRKRMRSALKTCRMGVAIFSRAFVNGLLNKTRPWCGFELRFLFARHSIQTNQRENGTGSLIGITYGNVTIAELSNNTQPIPPVIAAELGIDEDDWINWRNNLNDPDLLERFDDPNLTLSKIASAVSFEKLGQDLDHHDIEEWYPSFIKRVEKTLSLDSL